MGSPQGWAPARRGGRGVAHSDAVCSLAQAQEGGCCRLLWGVRRASRCVSARRGGLWGECEVPQPECHPLPARGANAPRYPPLEGPVTAHPPACHPPAPLRWRPHPTCCWPACRPIFHAPPRPAPPPTSPARPRARHVGIAAPTPAHFPLPHPSWPAPSHQTHAPPARPAARSPGSADALPSCPRCCQSWAPWCVQRDDERHEAGGPRGSGGRLWQAAARQALPRHAQAAAGPAPRKSQQQGRPVLLLGLYREQLRSNSPAQDQRQGSGTCLNHARRPNAATERAHAAPRGPGPRP